MNSTIDDSGEVMVMFKYLDDISDDLKSRKVYLLYVAVYAQINEAIHEIKPDYCDHDHILVEDGKWYTLYIDRCTCRKPHFSTRPSCFNATTEASV